MVHRRGVIMNKPATVAEDEEESAEDDAGDANVNTNYNAGGGCLALFVLHTVTGGI